MAASIALRMRGYVPQRQMLVIASSTCAVLGVPVFWMSATAAMIWPDWQYPHCGTCASIHACWTLWSVPFSPLKPSMVVTDLPATALTGTLHERVTSPSTCTEQAPHADMPQPNFVPVRPRSSRNAHSNGVSGSASMETALPLTVVSMAISKSSHSELRFI